MDLDRPRPPAWRHWLGTHTRPDAPSCTIVDDTGETPDLELWLVRAFDIADGAKSLGFPCGRVTLYLAFGPAGMLLPPHCTVRGNAGPDVVVRLQVERTLGGLRFRPAYAVNTGNN